MSLNQFDWSSEEYDGLFEKEIPSQLLQNPLLQKDIWRTVDDLNLKINAHKRKLTLNFESLKPAWFKLLVKLYILVKSKPNTPSVSACTRLDNCKIIVITQQVIKPEQKIVTASDKPEKKLVDPSKLKKLSNIFNKKND